MADTLQYPDHDARELGEYYTRHVYAMTAEDLYAKSGIAVQLAWRDREIDRLRSALAIKAPEPKIPMLARVFKMAIMAEGVEVQDVSVDNDGETLFDWMGPERQMISISLDDDGKVAWASSTRDAREHGTDFFEGTLSEDLRDIVRQALPWSNRPAQDADARDAARLDYLQERGATVEILPRANGWNFRVGGLFASKSLSIREAIDSAMAQARKEGGNGNSN